MPCDMLASGSSMSPSSCSSESQRGLGPKQSHHQHAALCNYMIYMLTFLRQHRLGSGKPHTCGARVLEVIGYTKKNDIKRVKKGPIFQESKDIKSPLASDFLNVWSAFMSCGTFFARSAPKAVWPATRAEGTWPGSMKLNPDLNHLGVSINWGAPKWMVYNGKNN